MLVMVVLFIAFRWIHLSTPLISLFRLVLILFFFSSRSRHTSFDCDWSSDVCSSDLELAARLDSLQNQVTAAQRALDAAREEEAEARKALAAADDRASHLASRVAALEALEREYHGFAPAVAAALTRRESFSGLMGPVAEFLHLPSDRAAAVEGTLGSLLQAIVVEDFNNIDDLQRWLTEAESSDAHADATATAHGPLKGAIALLPKEALPRLEALIESIRFIGRPPEEPVL